MLCLLVVIYCSFCCKSSKSIDSIQSQNTFLCLDISYFLDSFQFCCWFVCCFRTSRCMLVFSQRNNRWSMVWSSWPHMQLASSLRLNRLRYTLVIYTYIYIFMYLSLYMHLCVRARAPVWCSCVCARWSKKNSVTAGRKPKKSDREYHRRRKCVST
jgi:hypothetical protein